MDFQEMLVTGHGKEDQNTVMLMDSRGTLTFGLPIIIDQRSKGKGAFAVFSIIRRHSPGLNETRVLSACDSCDSCDSLT